MGRRRRWYHNGHVKPNGTVNGETSAVGSVNKVCVNGASPGSASETVAIQGYRYRVNGYESTTRMDKKTVTPPSTAAVINGNGMSSLSSEGEGTSSDTAGSPNGSSSDPVAPMTNKCDPTGPNKRWSNSYRFKKRNKVLEKPAIHVAPGLPRLPPQEKEDWSNGIQEIAKTIREDESHAGVINGNGISSHSSEPDSTRSYTPSSYQGMLWGNMGTRESKRIRGNRRGITKWKKRTKVSEEEYPAFPMAPRVQPQEEEDWSDEIEEFIKTVYDRSAPYDPEDLLKSELQGLRLYPNTSPIPGGMGNYVPATHHRRPVRWTCNRPSAEIGQFADAYE